MERIVFQVQEDVFAMGLSTVSDQMDTLARREQIATQGIVWWAFVVTRAVPAIFVLFAHLELALLSEVV